MNSSESHLSIYLFALGFLMVAALVIERYALKLKIQGALMLFGLALLINVGSYGVVVLHLEELHQIGIAILLFYAGLQIGPAVQQAKAKFKGELFHVILVSLLSLVLGTLLVGYLLTTPWSPFEGVKKPWLLGFMASYCYAIIDWGAIGFLFKRLRTHQEQVIRLFQYEASFGAAFLITIGTFVIEYFRFKGFQFPAFMSLGPLHAPMPILAISVLTGYLLARCLVGMIRVLRLERSEVTVATIGFIFLGYGLTHSLFQSTGGVSELVMGSYVALKTSANPHDYGPQSPQARRESDHAIDSHISLQLQSINIATEAALIFLVGLSINIGQLARTIPIGMALALCLYLIRIIAAFATHHLASLFFRDPSAIISGHEFWIWLTGAPKGVIGLALISCVPALIHEQSDGFKILFNLHHFEIIDTVCVAILSTMLIQALLLPSIYRRMLDLA